ncbi:Glutamyl-tRNA reductase [Cyclobacterium lianum]|uniref:Glutamyl-tRNA reductase n=1 Tax=Cyclobacterium lianum TaxID=388280 RepID=A0A1M7MJE7_9BACT|nr:hypothetical protein [Cyclobacterium lianum]SHM91078.1 Glutamyl-tRNA reductase [Cyclobacterium lianum]
MGQFRLLTFNAGITNRVTSDFYLDAEESKTLLVQLNRLAAIDEALVLSLPERTEILYYGPEALDEAIYSAIVGVKGMESVPEPNFFQHTCNEERALAHLTELCFGTQASTYGSVPLFSHFIAAFSIASQAGMTGELLDKWWGHLISTNKTIKNEVSFQFPNFSISYTVADMVTELIKKVKTPKIAIIGFNALGKRVYQNLTEKGFSNITIVEKSIRPFTSLDERELKNFIFEPYEQIFNVIQENDILISTLEDVETAIPSGEDSPEFKAPRVLIDLSLKGSFLNWLGDHELVITFELADIYQIIENKMEINKKWLKKVKPLIARRNAVFFDWMDKKKGLDILNQANELLVRNPCGEQFYTKVVSGKQLKVNRHMDTSLVNKSLLKMSIEKMSSQSPYKDIVNYERIVNEFYVYN